jgi:hypothetical protein
MKIAVVFILFAGIAFGQAKNDVGPANARPANSTNMNEVYRDESHCLTSPDMRGDQDNPISCYCRDAILMARYVYFTYLLPAKDDNLSGVFLVLQEHAIETCGDPSHSDASREVINSACEAKDWKWNGPEVVRTYPPDDVIDRIKPERMDGAKDLKPTGRWVPFTVQLIYRDAQGRVTRTENYSTREFEPVLQK